MPRVIWLTKRRRQSLEDEILVSVELARWMSEQIRGSDTEELRLQQLRLHIQDALGVGLSTWFNWRFWRQAKKCKPVPCPPFQEMNIDVLE